MGLALGRATAAVQRSAAPCRNDSPRDAWRACLQILSIVLLSLAPVYLWSMVVAAALGCYATWAEVTLRG